MPQLHVMPAPSPLPNTGVGQILLQVLLDRYVTQPFKQKHETKQWQAEKDWESEKSGKRNAIELLKSGNFDIVKEGEDFDVEVGGKKFRKASQNKTLQGFVNEAGDYIVPVVDKEGNKAHELNYGKKYQQLDNPWAWYFKTHKDINDKSVANFAKSMKDNQKMPKIIATVGPDNKEYWMVLTEDQLNKKASKGELIPKPKGITMADIYNTMFGFGGQTQPEGGPRKPLSEIIPTQ